MDYLVLISVECTVRAHISGAGHLEFDIRMNHVSFTYEGATEPAIRGIDLEIERGEVVLITGPAGAGKTTVCSCLNGLIPHFYGGILEGQVVVKGIDTTQAGIPRLSRYVGLLFQDASSQLFCPTIEDDIAFGAENHSIPTEEINERVEELLEILRLEKYRGKSGYSLSGGEQQSVALGAIMAMRPSIYVLDEPTSNLDPLGTDQVLTAIKDVVRREKKTLVIVEHKIEELAPFVDRIVVIDNGRIVIEGTPRDVLKDAATMKNIGLKPPQVNLLLGELEIGSTEVPITLDEAYDVLLKVIRRKERRPILHEEAVQVLKRLGPPAIEVRDLWFVYPYVGTTALRGVNLVVHEGEFIGLIGMNGSGKTTLVKHFNGLLKPTKGKLFVCGEDTTAVRASELAQKVGFVFQNPDHQIFKNKVKDEVAFGPKNLGLSVEEVRRRVINALKKVNVEHLIEKNPFELSMGEKQRVNVASVIAMEPKILVVDEPTTGQDFLRGKQIMELTMKMHREGKTIIVISHDMNLIAEYVERVVVLKDGEITFDGPTREAFSQPKMLARTCLKPPQITRLAQKLEEFGVPPDILTVEEMKNVLNEML